MSSRPFGVTLCVLAVVGLVFSVLLLIRGDDRVQAVIVIVIEIGGLVVGIGAIRRSALSSAPPE